MSYAGRVCGVFVFGDELKPNSIQAVSRLHGAGYRVALVSGDDDQTTKAIAREVGIDEAQGGKLPQEKASFISALQQQGQLVAMVGDGINDAPALVQADLAIAVHSGSFIYNLVSIPIAMSGLLTPLIAVSAMLLSSLSVIGNTLLLLKRVN
jgi:P-type E1-E2 ATPase